MSECILVWLFPIVFLKWVPVKLTWTRLSSRRIRTCCERTWTAWRRKTKRVKARKLKPHNDGQCWSERQVCTIHSTLVPLRLPISPGWCQWHHHHQDVTSGDPANVWHLLLQTTENTIWFVCVWFNDRFQFVRMQIMLLSNIFLYISSHILI